ncbi:hypothetical protein FIBSPDRAFT_865661 [Athelia psychrophila]|uniref:Uncharacterized protein n=1 Tax=Athelia psychrophila TaxID=1759441 RepID=A0A166FDJ5_9AGAM|nr:hypothetical protein FIBSPDRAFT_865661 [Fibularhizoctonia sp. CBS 109695]
MDCISSSERKELQTTLQVAPPLLHSSSTVLGRYAMPPVALQSPSLMLCPFYVDVDPLIVPQTHGHIPCRNSPS